MADSLGFVHVTTPLFACTKLFLKRLFDTASIFNTPLKEDIPTLTELEIREKERARGKGGGGAGWCDKQKERMFEMQFL